MSIEKKALDAEAERQQELNDLKSILATEHGKRFIQRILDRAGIHQPTYGSGGNISDFAFMEGRREMGLFILGEVTQADNNAWIDMQRNKHEQLENLKHERRNNSTSSN
ncbi:hypothetical protein [Acinetobacter puyangensis]|uniref:Bbp19 family protein n=1 Tax=Acinetobacter puyangensis TaxID=1096779 RepID=UPI003A4DBFAB